MQQEESWQNYPWLWQCPGGSGPGVMLSGEFAQLECHRKLKAGTAIPAKHRNSCQTGTAHIWMICQVSDLPSLSFCLLQPCALKSASGYEQSKLAVKWNRDGAVLHQLLHRKRPRHGGVCAEVLFRGWTKREDMLLQPGQFCFWPSSQMVKTAESMNLDGTHCGDHNSDVDTSVLSTPCWRYLFYWTVYP